MRLGDTDCGVLPALVFVEVGGEGSVVSSASSTPSARMPLRFHSISSERQSKITQFSEMPLIPAPTRSVECVDTSGMPNTENRRRATKAGRELGELVEELLLLGAVKPRHERDRLDLGEAFCEAGLSVVALVPALRR